MKSRRHFLASSSISLFLLYYGQYVPALLSLIFGWLIDADHEVDYYICHKEIALNPLTMANELGGSHLFTKNKRRMFLPLHGWEWLVVGVVFNVNIGVLVSYFLHLAMDVIGNYTYPRYMSLFWRWSKGWKVRLRKEGYD